MTFLAIDDVAAIVSCVAEAGDPLTDTPIPVRKSKLAARLAELIDADIWIWSTAAFDPSCTDAMSTYLLHGGWNDTLQQGRVFEALTDPTINNALSGCMQAAKEGRYLTFRRNDLMSEEDWQQVRELWLRSGLEHSILSIYPLGQNAFSGIGFHRRIGKPNFTVRERAIIHVVFQQVDWLHRHGTNEPASERVLDLSPRARQVLMMLLSGDSRKEISAKLGISVHTVGDYMKQLHKHFSVNSRAELQAYFLTGGTHSK